MNTKAGNRKQYIQLYPEVLIQPISAFIQVAGKDNKRYSACQRREKPGKEDEQRITEQCITFYLLQTTHTLPGLGV